MKQKILILLMALFSLPSFARDFTYEYEGQTLTYTVIDEDAKTCKTKEGRENLNYNNWTISYYAGNEVTGVLKIPTTVSDGTSEFTVIAFGDYAFATCRELTSVEIPSSITSIADYAFYSCGGLTSVEIPSSITSIADYAFYSCVGLTSIELPSKLTSIGEMAFRECTGLASVLIPDSVASIGSYAFYDCSSLASIVLPKSVNSVGNYAFNNCGKLMKAAYPDNLYNPFENWFGSMESVRVAYPAEDALIENGFIYSADKQSLLFVPVNLEGEFTVPDH